MRVTSSLPQRVARRTARTIPESPDPAPRRPTTRPARRSGPAAPSRASAHSRRRAPAARTARAVRLNNASRSRASNSLRGNATAGTSTSRCARGSARAKSAYPRTKFVGGVARQHAAAVGLHGDVGDNQRRHRKFFVRTGGRAQHIRSGLRRAGFGAREQPACPRGPILPPAMRDRSPVRRCRRSMASRCAHSPRRRSKSIPAQAIPIADRPRPRAWRSAAARPSRPTAAAAARLRCPTRRRAVGRGPHQPQHRRVHGRFDT